MPLEDALSLISKDFDHYMMSGRASAATRKPAASSDVPHLLGKAASGASLSSNELTAVISALQKQKQRDEMATTVHHGIQQCGVSTIPYTHFTMFKACFRYMYIHMHVAGTCWYMYIHIHVAGTCHVYNGLRCSGNVVITLLTWFQLGFPNSALPHPRMVAL